jgi:dihydrofolate reductase
MAKLLYAVSMSLDGFTAGPGGDMSWLTPHLGPNPLVEELIPRIGALLVGNRTFRGDDPHRGTERAGKPFGGGWDGPQVILTHHAPADPVAGITFATDLTSAVEQARAAAGDRYVNILGASVAAQCLRAGLVDEILVLVVPVLLGDGIRLYDHPGGTDIRLERLDVDAAAPNSTGLWFRVSRP